MPDRVLVRPGLLLDVVTGEPLTGRTVVVDGDRIAAITGGGDAPAAGPVVVDLPDHTLLPGLIDCHTHLVGEPDDGRGYAEAAAAATSPGWPRTSTRSCRTNCGSVWSTPSTTSAAPCAACCRAARTS